MATTTRRHPKVPPTPAPVSREQLERRRNGVLATAPSGELYRIRQINLERHALSGGLPASLVQVAIEGAEALGKVFEGLAQPDLTPEQREHNQEVREYLDNIVIASVIEPALTKDDLGDPTVLDASPLLPPMDYQWFVQVAFRNTDEDAEGKRLWGTEPLSRFQLFRDFHSCPPDCEGCEGLRLAVSARVAGDNA